MSEVYYVYVDEAGQNDGRGDAFHVGIVIIGSASKDDLEAQLRRMEKAAGKRGKWNGCSALVKARFLQILLEGSIPGLYWHRIEAQASSDYGEVTASAAARAMQRMMVEGRQFILVIDALKKSKRQEVARLLRDHGVRWRAIHVGKQEENEPLLRLADAIAGFTRDVHHGKPYTVELWKSVGELLEGI